MTRAASMIDRPFAPPLSENDIQRAVFDHIKKRGRPGIVAFHPKNSGIHQRGRHRGINAGLGVLSGVHDVIILAPGPMVYTLELKKDDKKGPTDEQTEFYAKVIALGGKSAFAFSLDDALARLEDWGLLRGTVA